MHSNEVNKPFLKPKLNLKKKCGQVRISFGYSLIMLYSFMDAEAEWIVYKYRNR